MNYVTGYAVNGERLRFERWLYERWLVGGVHDPFLVGALRRCASFTLHY